MTDDFDPLSVAWIMDQATLDRFQSILLIQKEVTWDVETSGLTNNLNEYDREAKIVFATFTFDNGDTWALPLYHPESPWLGQWRKIMRQVANLLVGKFLIAHNGKFDCRWVYRHTGVDLSHWLMWDSSISAHLLDENVTRKLKPLAEATFGVPRWDDFDLSAPGAALRVPLFDLGFYASRDTYWTWRLAMKHRERMYMLPDQDEPYDDDEIEEARLGRLAHWIALPTARTMTKVEQRGIRLDREWTDSRIAEENAVRDETREFLVTRYPGIDRNEASFAPTSHWFMNWTKTAVEAGDLKVASLTKGGKPQWSRQVLTRQMREGSKVAEELLRHRGAVKRLEYLHAWKWTCREDGYIHAHYNVGSLITGRLSSSEPNMQQVTKRLRPAFVPRPGYVIADIDQSQIELRVAAFIARCQPMIEAFLRGDDLHRLIAARITGKPSHLVDGDERQGGKAGNFGFLFGQTAYGFRFYAENTYGLSFNDREAQAIYNAFFEQWDGMAQWHAKTISTLHRTGQVKSPLGRIRRLPHVYSANEGRVKHAENAALNAPVQGFASDLTLTAASLIEGTVPGYEHLAVKNAHLLATVHDSLVVEVPEDDWETPVRECIDRMTQGVLPILRKMDVDFDVPLVAEASIGTRWGLSDVGEIK